MAKRKTTLTRERLLQDPVFEHSRETMSEFGRAGKANRLIRHAHLLVLRNFADRYVSGRLTRVMMSVIQSDPVNGRGKRTVRQGELSILEGFNFNNDTNLQQVLRTSWQVTADQTRVAIELPMLMPRAMIGAPSGADYFRLTGIAAAIDFEKEAYPVKPVTTDFLDVNKRVREAVQLVCPVPEGTEPPIIVSLGISFYRYVSGEFLMLEKTQNAMAVVKVIKE